MSREVVATGFIIYRLINSEIQYLLLQASYAPHHWTPPKGHVDPGEDELQTAIRETSEEAGFKSEQYSIVYNYRATLRYEVKGRQKRVEYWLAKLKDPSDSVRLSDEHQDYKWLKLTEAMTYAGFPEMQDALKEAETAISQSST